MAEIYFPQGDVHGRCIRRLHPLGGGFIGLLHLFLLKVYADQTRVGIGRFGGFLKDLIIVLDGSIKLPTIVMPNRFA